MIQNNTTQHDHRIVETVTSGPGHLPDRLIPQPLWTTRTNVSPSDLFSNEAGMLTICAHGQILREGWPSLSLDVTGEELALLVKKHRPHAIHYSAIPAHCTDCAQPTDDGGRHDQNPHHHMES